LLVFEDAIEALGKRTHENRAGFGNHRVYGFTDPQLPMSVKDHLMLETLAGPVIYRAQSQSRRSIASIEVVLADAPLRRTPRADGPRRQKEDLWGDQQRNALIALVADAFAAQVPAPLWDAGLMLDDETPFARWNHAPIVAVVVESAWHADLLAHTLPDWPVLHARSPHDASESTRPRGWSDWLLPARSIVTITRAANMKAFNADVVVMATGGAVPQLPQGLIRRRGSVLVVDFDDGDDGAAAGDMHRRMQHYRDLGCHVTPQGIPAR
jgi:hypothetical protein